MAGNLENARDLGAGIYTQAEVDAAITDEPKVSASASSVLLGGNLALANYAVTKNFATKPYTGNGGTQSINTGISSVDFTVASNGSGFWLDRTTNQVKNDAGTVQASGSCVCNVSKVHIKRRDSIGWNTVYDGLRGIYERIATNETNNEATNVNGLTIFSATGFSVGSHADHNASSSTYVAYQTLYTHIKWGTTNQGKFYVEAYNPVTREGMIYYIGSGIAGHEIPHSQGVKLDLLTTKKLSNTSSWAVGNSFDESQYLLLNSTSAYGSAQIFTFGTDSTSLSTGDSLNILSEEYISYYKTKSETWTIVPYQGTGASGNFIETVDVNGVARKPRRVTFKRTNTTSDWVVWDSERGNTVNIDLNNSTAETSYTSFNFVSNGIEFTTGSFPNDTNQYIALVEFDTNGNGGDSYFDLPTDDSNLNVTAGTFTYTNGIGSNGYERSAEAYTGAIDFAGIPDGLQWVYKTEAGSFGSVADKPTVVSDAPTGAISEYQFSTKEGKWYDLTGTALTTPVSFLPNPIMVASETPMDIRYDDELAYEVAESIAVKDHIELDGVKVKGFLGQGQTWQDVTSERSDGITYTNDTGKPIQVSITKLHSSGGNIIIDVDDMSEAIIQNISSNYWGNVTIVVPDGSTYKSVTSGGYTNIKWWELR